MDVIQAFTQLEHAIKIEKLKHLLQIFSSYSVVARDTLVLIDQHPDNLTDDEMIKVYSLFVKAIQDTKSQNLQEAVAHLSTIQQRLSYIHQQEAIEKSKEDPDMLLEGL
jgi:hypothetical protein